MSPHCLIQERLARDADYPWRVLVSCALLNRTGRKAVRGMYEELFRRWPSPQDMARSGAALERALRPLGLWRRRAALLRRLSRDCAAGLPPAECHGVGQYALDAHAIFVEGVLPDRVDDGFLKKYLRWRKRYGR